MLLPDSRKPDLDTFFALHRPWTHFDAAHSLRRISPRCVRLSGAAFGAYRQCAAARRRLRPVQGFPAGDSGVAGRLPRLLRRAQERRRGGDLCRHRNQALPAVQHLPDGGIVRGVAGGGFGVIMQDASVRRMAYAPGSPVIFQIERIAEDHGILAPSSLVRDGDRVFYLASEGFYTMTATGTPEPIGKERVDRTFLADVDPANLQLLIGASDPRASRVFWSYKSVSGQTGLF